MHIYTPRCEMLTHSSLQETFKIFENPYNLAKITPPWLNFKVTSKERARMRKGAEIEYTIGWLGIPMHWKTVIQEYEPPFLFVDEQAEGPYALWRHRHTFAPAGEGTMVGDRADCVSRRVLRDLDRKSLSQRHLGWPDQIRLDELGRRLLRTTG